MYSDEVVIMTIRHGETDFNRQKRYAGLLDVPLNEKGRSDCQMASRYLAESVEVAVASKLKRAIETAHILTGYSRPVMESALCNERNFGLMQGRTSQEVESVRPEITYVRIGGDFHSLNPPQGERFPALYGRAREFLGFIRFILSERRCTRMLIVSHEVFLLQFHGVLRGETWRESLRHALPNLMLSTFLLQGARLLNETSRKLVPEMQESWHIVPVAKGVGRGSEEVIAASLMR
ncbi:MAG: histidine phosphatase family protein [Sedimentisphaerales bacterium]|nr:histidine phosphatase family protein [Sedimentisphaerales bacterium]